MKNKPTVCWDPRYYTLNKLSEAELFIIRRGLERLLEEYEVNWPLDCFELVKHIQAKGKIQLALLYDDKLDSRCDGVSQKITEGVFEITIRPPHEGWKDWSAWRRCNFTVAHELGHVFCDHLDIPRHNKSDSQIEREDLEADEFAGRLLMPRPLILCSRAPSIEKLAGAFFVSESACFKRLNNLKRLNILQPAAERAVCPNCGNDRFSPGADYCGICGLKIYPGWQDSVLVVPYARPPESPDGRIQICPVCRSGDFSPQARFCRICGTPLYNACEDRNEPWQCRRISALNARFCEGCGSRTDYFRRGWLPDWRAERNAWIRESDLPCGDMPSAVDLPEAYEDPLPENAWGPAEECPYCGSAKVLRNGVTCGACGKSKRNLCLGPAEHTARANDRFCEVCGAKTRFFADGLLPGAAR